MALSDHDRALLRQIAERMTRCRSLLFITGAGISADSNLPTYRGVGGLYNDADAEEGIPIEEALSGGMLTRRPDIAWRHISRIEEACRDASYNRGHAVIAQVEQRFERVWVLTQNVDGFHRDAGSKNIIDIHGDVRKLACTNCNWRTVVDNYASLESMPPACPDCKALVRPEVVLFGEMLPEEKMGALSEQAELGFDMVFTVGTSSLFPYIVEPVVAAKQWGIPTVEINPGRTDLSAMVDYKVSAGAADSLGYLWDVLSNGDAK